MSRDRGQVRDSLNATLAAHGAHKWEEVGLCVWCVDCHVRLYQGDLPLERDPHRQSRRAACDHDWDMEQGLGFYLICKTCGFKEWTE